MCGGYVCTWEKPKHLWKYKGTPILKRTVDMLKKYGAKDIVITTGKELVETYSKFGVEVIEHESNNSPYYWVDCFYRVDEPVCYIFGDVVYSAKAIKTIMNTETDDIEFFASAPPFAPNYPKPYAEPFAFKVVDTERFFECVEQTRWYDAHNYFNRDAIAWELWQVIKHTPLNIINYNNYTIINDYTCDIDWEYEMAQWDKKTT